MCDVVSSKMSSQAPPFDSSRTLVVERRVSGMTIANTTAAKGSAVLRRAGTGCQQSTSTAHSIFFFLNTQPNKVNSRDLGKGYGLTACMVM